MNLAIPVSSAGLQQLGTRIAGRVQLGLYSRTMRYGLRRDLSLSLERPSAKIPLSIRPLVEADVPSLLSMSNPQSDSRDQLEIAWRRAFLEKGAKSCFVAIDLRNGTPCYMQWLLSSAETDG